MKINGSLTVAEQLGADIGDEWVNTLAVTTHGGGMVYLDVAGALDVGGAEADSHILTVMTVSECTALIRLLQAAVMAAAGEVAAAEIAAKAAPTAPAAPTVPATPGIYPWEAGYEL